MVDFITQNPATNALRTRTKGVASADEQRLTSEQNRLNEAVEKRRLQNVDDNIRVLLSRLPQVTPQGQPVEQAAKAQQVSGAGGATDAFKSGGQPDSGLLPAASRGTPGQLVTNPRDLINQARLGVPGLRAQGLEGLAAEKQRVAAVEVEQENKDLSNLIQIAKTSPSQAIAFAQLQKMNLPPNFIFALQNASFTKRLNEELERARKHFALDKVMGQTPENQAAFNKHMADVIVKMNAALASVTQDNSPVPGGEPDPVTGAGRPVSAAPGAGVGLPRNQVPNFGDVSTIVPPAGTFKETRNRFVMKPGVKDGKKGTLVFDRIMGGEPKFFEGPTQIGTGRTSTKRSAKLQLIDALMAADESLSFADALKLSNVGKSKPEARVKLIAKIAAAIQDDLERSPSPTFNEAMAEAEALVDRMIAEESGGGGQVFPLPKTQAELVEGRTYQTKQGPGKWNGKTFDRVK